MRRGHHNPFLIGMRPSDRITLFIRNVVLHIAFNGTTSGRPNLSQPSEPYVIQNRRGIAAERLRCTGKITDARRSRQALEVADFHGLDTLTSALGTPITRSVSLEFRHQTFSNSPLEAIGVNCENAASSHPPLTPAGFARRTSQRLAASQSGYPSCISPGPDTISTGRNMPLLSVRKISRKPGFC